MKGGINSRTADTQIDGVSRLMLIPYLVKVTRVVNRMAVEGKNLITAK